MVLVDGKMGTCMDVEEMKRGEGKREMCKVSKRERESVEMEGWLMDGRERWRITGNR